MHLPDDFESSCDPPYDFVEVPPEGDSPLPEEVRKRVFIHTVHDGHAIPREYRFKENGEPLVDADELEARFVRERDWGANLVARKLAAALGVKGFARCRVARVLVDFNRFPGSTPPHNTSPLDRLAISPPFTTALDHTQKLELLENYYDRISDLIEEQWLNGNLIMIGIHTYDEHNPTLTRRPDLSLVTRPANYQRESRMPYGVFDPLYPDGLGESTSSRILRDRISLNLERNGFRMGHNHPYALPEGSMEVRAQVWYFFDFLRQRFAEVYPESVPDPAYQLVWTMLLNTNLRLHRAESLRGYLHRYRKVSREEVGSFQRSQVAYERVRTFLEEQDILQQFRTSPNRPSSIALEVRKDLICTFNGTTGRPLPVTKEIEDRAALIGAVVAGAIGIYFDTDSKFRCASSGLTPKSIPFGNPTGPSAR